MPHQGYNYYLKKLGGLIKFNNLNEIPDKFTEMMKTTIPFFRTRATARSWYKIRSFENIESQLFHCTGHIRNTILECGCCDTFNKDQEAMTIQFLRTLLFELFTKQTKIKSSLLRIDYYWNIDLRNADDMNIFIIENGEQYSLYKFNNNLVESQLLKNENSELISEISSIINGGNE